MSFATTANIKIEKTLNPLISPILFTLISLSCTVILSILSFSKLCKNPTKAIT